MNVSHEVHPLAGPGPEQRRLFNTEAEYKFVNPIRMDFDAGLLALQALIDGSFFFFYAYTWFLCTL